MATPYMTLTLPVVGPAGTAGPTYATLQNEAMNVIDSHDHTTGKGVKVTPAGINVNQDFTFSGFGITSLNYAKYVNNVVDVSDYTSVYGKNGDLYWRNAAGTVVQVTSGATVNVTAAGGIGGDYTTSTASVIYSDVTKTYTFKQSATVTGDIAAGSLYVYENVVSGKYVKFQAPAGLAANYNLTLPAALPAVKKLVSMDASGNIAADGDTLVPSASYDAKNYTITATVAASALTVSIKNQAGSDASASSPCLISFRSSTATSGLYNQRLVSAALSMVVSSGSTLGHTSATATYIYVYAIDNAGTVELAVSSTLFDDKVVQSTTAEGGAGGADTSSLLYSTAARSNVPIKLLARLTSNQTTAGTWAAVPTAIVLTNINKDPANYQLSASSSNVTTASTSFVDANNLSVTITTSGRPVYLAIISDGGGSISRFAADRAAGSISAEAQFTRNGTSLGFHNLQYVIGAATSISYAIPANLSQIDFPSAGTYTYKLQIRCNLATSFGALQSKLVAIEL
jgi:hypothetical protein